MTRHDETVTVRLRIDDANRLPGMLWTVIDAIDGEVEELPDGTMDTIDRLALTIHQSTKGSAQ